MSKLVSALAVASLLLAGQAQAQSRPDQVAFRALYKELVETNTTASAGDCTLAASGWPPTSRPRASPTAT